MKFDVDKAALADYVLGKVSEIIKRETKTHNNPTSCPELPLEKLDSNKSGEKTPNQAVGDMASFRSIRETKLAESVYEPISRLSVMEEAKKEVKNESLSSSKSLTDSCGFHFVMKYDNGRPRFVPVPINPQDLEKKYQESSGDGGSTPEAKRKRLIQ